MLHYHYTESGLDNVFLQNGFALENDTHYGELVSFTDISGLHDNLDRVLVSKAPYLTGAAMRLLRTDVFEQSPEEFASTIGVSAKDIKALEGRGNVFVGRRTDVALREQVREHKQITDERFTVTSDHRADRPFFIIMALEDGVWTGGISCVPPAS